MKRMTEAAYELHLMQEGEEFLGSLCWPGTEEIDDISMEYWSIRRIEKEREALEEKIVESNKLLHAAHVARTTVTDRSKDIGQELFSEREQLFDSLEALNLDRDEIMSKAQQVKRRFEALKTKAKVLKDESGDETEAYTDTRKVLDDLRDQFRSFKVKLSKIDDEIDEEQKKLADLQENIDAKLKGNKDEASETFGQISKANRDITKSKAELGLLIEEHAKLCREIGRYLNLNARLPECQDACKEHRGLLEQIRLLRRSIQWNKKLVEKAGS
ncbi:hypothetical protein N9Z02_01690 [Akkermansiaceae bacterium]|nr:hypothetical protein [Akkermansiaceae bacterium]